MEEKKKVTNKKKTVASKKKVVVPKQETNTKTIVKNGRINNVSILIQAILTTYAVLLLVGGLFDELFLDIFDAIASMLLFVIAYNNDKIFKRKNLTAIYVMAGILFAGMFLFRIFN